LGPDSISALAATFGSITSALASSVSTWITQRHQNRRDILAKRIFYLEQLYPDFISENAHALADAKWLPARLNTFDTHSTLI